MGDLSARAAEVLAAADAICCEDSRRTGKLLLLAGIERRGPLLQVNEHTEERRVDEVLRRLERGETVAVVTDAGMPGIADPGERLVRAAAAAGHRVDVVPGPSAAIAALVASGLPTGRFVFEGFLPRKGADRAARLAALAHEPRTIVVYEAPHRVARTLVDLRAALGAPRRAAIGRELTKLHEEVHRGTLEELAASTSERELAGELVIVVEGASPAAAPTDDDVRAAIERALADGASTRDAAARVAAELGIAKRRAYALATTVARPSP